MFYTPDFKIPIWRSCPTKSGSDRFAEPSAGGGFLFHDTAWQPSTTYFEQAIKTPKRMLFRLFGTMAIFKKDDI